MCSPFLAQRALHVAPRRGLVKGRLCIAGPTRLGRYSLSAPAVRQSSAPCGEPCLERRSSRSTVRRTTSVPGFLHGPSHTSWGLCSPFFSGFVARHCHRVAVLQAVKRCQAAVSSTGDTIPGPSAASTQNMKDCRKPSEPPVGDKVWAGGLPVGESLV